MSKMTFESTDPLKLTKINKFIGNEICIHLIIKEKVIMGEWNGKEWWILRVMYISII